MATEEDKVNTGALATLVVVGLFAMVGISLALVAFVRDELSVEAVLKDAEADASYRALRAAQFASLQTGVPIESAMQAVVRELAEKPDRATPPQILVPVADGSGGAAQAAPEPSPPKDGKLSLPAPTAPPAAVPGAPPATAAAPQPGTPPVPAASHGQ